MGRESSLYPTILELLGNVHPSVCVYNTSTRLLHGGNAHASTATLSGNPDRSGRFDFFGPDEPGRIQGTQVSFASRLQTHARSAGHAQGPDETSQDQHHPGQIPRNRLPSPWTRAPLRGRLSEDDQADE